MVDLFRINLNLTKQSIIIKCKLIMSPVERETTTRNDHGNIRTALSRYIDVLSVHNLYNIYDLIFPITFCEIFHVSYTIFFINS